MDAEADGRVVLRPDPVVTGIWAGLGVLGVLGCVWLVGWSGASLLGLALLLPTVALTAVFALQAVAPGDSTVVVEDGRLHGRLLRREVDVDLASARHAEVTRTWGEPALTVVDADGERSTMLLPVGASTGSLAGELERRGLSRRPADDPR